MARRRRRLSEEDRALWEKVVRDASPLRGTRPGVERAETAIPDGAGKGPAAPEAAPPNIPKSRPARPAERVVKPVGRPAPKISHAPLRPVLDTLDPAAGLDRRTADRLRRGLRPPEARLDLHGMTADRAHGALIGFIRQSRRAGRRCVLIITGKGGRKAPEDAPFMPERTGVLRHAVPHWLATAPLAGEIVGVYPAHRRHGGDGAYYVYLKKR